MLRVCLKIRKCPWCNADSPVRHTGIYIVAKFLKKNLSNLIFCLFAGAGLVLSVVSVPVLTGRASVTPRISSRSVIFSSSIGGRGMGVFSLPIHWSFFIMSLKIFFDPSV